MVTGSTRSGTHSWLLQRVSALIIAVYALFLVAFWSLNAPLSYPVWHGLMQQGGMKLFTVLFWASLLAHAWIGMRDILMDYVWHNGWRLTLRLVVQLSLAVYFIWGLSIVWSL